MNYTQETNLSSERNAGLNALDGSINFHQVWIAPTDFSFTPPDTPASNTSDPKDFLQFGEGINSIQQEGENRKEKDPGNFCPYDIVGAELIEQHQRELENKTNLEQDNQVCQKAKTKTQKRKFKESITIPFEKLNITCLTRNRMQTSNNEECINRNGDKMRPLVINKNTKGFQSLKILCEMFPDCLRLLKRWNDETTEFELFISFEVEGKGAFLKRIDCRSDAFSHQMKKIGFVSIKRTGKRGNKAGYGDFMHFEMPLYPSSATEEQKRQLDDLIFSVDDQKEANNTNHNNNISLPTFDQPIDDLISNFHRSDFVPNYDPSEEFDINSQSESMFDFDELQESLCSIQSDEDNKRRKIEPLQQSNDDFLNKKEPSFEEELEHYFGPSQEPSFSEDSFWDTFF